MENASEIHEERLSRSMLPFVVRELAGMVMRRKSLPLEDALHYIYTSGLYGSLLDEDAKQWYSSTLSLYETLEKEKAEERRKENADAKALLFKVFCLENYRTAKGLSAEEALSLFSRYRVFDFLDSTFEMLHTQDADYMTDTIATYIKTKER